MYKYGKSDAEVNNIAKVLFVLMLVLAAFIIIIRPPIPISWILAIDYNRFVILFSFLIPMSMKVNLEFAKIFYCLQISGDKDMPGSLARNSQIPEQLGRIDYLMMDKTGTLTKNEMRFQKIVIGSRPYSLAELSSFRAAATPALVRRSFSAHKPD